MKGMRPQQQHCLLSLSTMSMHRYRASHHAYSSCGWIGRWLVPGRRNGDEAGASKHASTATASTMAGTMAASARRATACTGSTTILYGTSTGCVIAACSAFRKPGGTASGHACTTTHVSAVQPGDA